MPTDSSSSLTITIGPGVGLHIGDPAGGPLLREESSTRAFCGPGPAVLSLTVDRDPPPFGALDPIILGSRPWRVYRDGDQHVFALFAGEAAEPYEVAVVDFVARTGRIYLAAAGRRQSYPLEFPLDEVLFSKLLADRDGLIVHACGLDTGDRGILLAGHSGAGKSTLASIVTEHSLGTVLSDDRVAVSVGDRGASMYGTPWHGTSGFALARSTALDCILLLRHATANVARRLSPLEAAARVLALSVIPYWDPGAAEKAIATGVTLALRLPCFEFGFVPDRTAADFLCSLDLSGSGYDELLPREARRR